jgi:pimeloyl-ACP methyl ester carboxylesterase
VVLAPGTLSHLGLDWERPDRVGLIETLSSFCRLIRFDKRGTGLSDQPLTVATLEQRTDDIRAVMEAAGSERAVALRSTSQPVSRESPRATKWSSRAPSAT